MATGGEDQEQCHGGLGSENLLKCQPCLENGNLRDAVGMCIECQDYLCSQCFNVHTVPKPSRNHQLLDKEQMLQNQIRTSPKDICTEKCAVHEDKIVEYYCTTHSLLGCTVCITLDHTTCKGVQYIPHVTQELATNEEYSQLVNKLKSALSSFEKVSENVQQKTEEFETSCNEALEKIKDFRKKVERAFDEIEAKLVEQANVIKTKEMNELAAISDKYQKAHEELQAALAKIDALQNSKHNCCLYTEMMKTKDKLKAMDANIKEAEVDKSYRECQIRFAPNQETLDLLKKLDTFGILSVKEIHYKNIIVSAKHDCDIQVNTGTDRFTCWITGLVLLPEGRLVLADHGNGKIKTVNVQSSKVLTELNISSPWDVTAINNNKIAVTLSDEKKLAIVSVGVKNLSIDRTLEVSGFCNGVDCRNDKLAVSFYDPKQVQVLNLHGTVLHTISTDKQGQVLFNFPKYLTFGQDDSTLYVSNTVGNNIVCVKLDGTVVAKYTDNGLDSPFKLVVDNNGNVYVCASNSHKIHQISKDCKKIKVLLTHADGLCRPYSICLSEEEDKLYVGMMSNNNVKVYKTERNILRLNEVHIVD